MSERRPPADKTASSGSDAMGGEVNLSAGWHGTWTWTPSTGEMHLPDGAGGREPEQWVGVVALELEQVIGKAPALARPDLDMLQIGVTVEFAPGLPRVRSKDPPLQQVFVNLLMNARDALANAPERRVRIGARREAGFVAVDVTDSGAGVPLEIQEEIFDPFFTTKEPGCATGRGLSASRSIMLELGGDLVYQATEAGRGATFTVLIPIAERAAS